MRIMNPGDEKSEQFKPTGKFLLIANGPLETTIRVFGIPKFVLDDEKISDKSEYWTELDPAESLSKTQKTARLDCITGLVCELRADAAITCYVIWDHAINFVGSSLITL